MVVAAYLNIIPLVEMPFDENLSIQTNKQTNKALIRDILFMKCVLQQSAGKWKHRVSFTRE